MDTNSFFAGGAGMFIQYHDIIKPVYFYSIIKMIMNNDAYGLPIQILKNYSMMSLLEWYIKRRYQNPLRQLDYNHSIDPSKLDELLQITLNEDPSLYTISPELPTMRMFDVYRSQHMDFPVFIYTKEEEPNITDDLDSLFQSIKYKYVYGDLKESLKQTNENFTYIFSDIELAKQASEILIGTCSNILIPRDYRYNFKDNCKTFKYDLHQLSYEHPFVRLETILAMDLRLMGGAFDNIIQGGG